MKDFFKLAAVAVPVMIFVVICSGMLAKPKAPQNNIDIARKAASDALQQGRRELIDNLIQERIFQKIDTPGTVPRVYVLPAFFVLTFDEKAAFVNVCYAYTFRLPKSDLKGFDKPMWVYNAMTDKKIGSFSATWGLKLD